MDGLDVYRLDEPRIPQQLSTGVDLKGTSLLQFDGGRDVSTTEAPLALFNDTVQTVVFIFVG